MMRRIPLPVQLATMLFLLLPVLGCEAPPQASETLRQLQTQVGGHLQDAKQLTAEEIEKIFRIDYAVFELPADVSRSNLAAALERYGKERWDCFDVEHGEDTLRIYCKRRPTSYIEYAAKFL